MGPSLNWPADYQIGLRGLSPPLAPHFVSDAPLPVQPHGAQPPNPLTFTFCHGHEVHGGIYARRCRMKVALYVRRSTIDLQPDSLAAQEELLRAHATAQAHEVVRVYSDSASGSTPRSARDFSGSLMT